MNHPLFILGNPKSGTTLVTALLDSHPEIMVLPEESDFYTVVEPLITSLKYMKGLSIDERVALLSKKIFEETYLRNLFRGKVENDIGGNFDYSHFRTEQFKVQVSEAIRKSTTSSKRIFLGVIEAFTKAAYSEEEIGYLKYWVEKTPSHTFRYNKLLKDFPEAKFIFILRDPRDNFVSYTAREGSRLNALTFSYFWTRSVQALEHLPFDKTIMIRYEDLVKEPHESVEKIISFLRIAKNVSLYQPSKMGHTWRGNSMFGDKKDGIDATKLSRYKSMINKNDLEVVEALCGRKMLQYGYRKDLSQRLPSVSKAHMRLFVLKNQLFFAKIKKRIGTL